MTAQPEQGNDAARPEPGRPDHGCASFFRGEVYLDPETLPDPGAHGVAGTVVCPHGFVYRTAPVQLDGEL